MERQVYMRIRNIRSAFLLSTSANDGEGRTINANCSIYNYKTAIHLFYPSGNRLAIYDKEKEKFVIWEKHLLHHGKIGTTALNYTRAFCGLDKNALKIKKGTDGKKLENNAPQIVEICEE